MDGIKNSKMNGIKKIGRIMNRRSMSGMKNGILMRISIKRIIGIHQSYTAIKEKCSFLRHV